MTPITAALVAACKDALYLMGTPGAKAGNPAPSRSTIYAAIEAAEAADAAPADLLEQVAEKLADTMDPDNARAMARALWNARGAADRTAIDATLATLVGWVTSEPYRQAIAAAIAAQDQS